MISIVPQMDNERLGALIEEHASVIEGQGGYWRVRYAGRDLWVITDEPHDRMRVMTPAADADAVDEDDRRVMLSANFDRALDARYAVAKGYVWSLFIHPLASLSDALFIDALQQVATLADNFGTSFTSGGLVFGGDEE